MGRVRWSKLLPFEDDIRHRVALGYTYAEIATWLRWEHDIVTKGQNVWRFMHPGPPKVSRSLSQKRRELWVRLRAEGLTLAEIAERSGVTRQAVHAALRKAVEMDTSAP